MKGRTETDYPGCISNCCRLMGTPAGAAAVGGVFTAHMKQGDNSKCTRYPSSKSKA